MLATGNPTPAEDSRNWRARSLSISTANSPGKKHSHLLSRAGSIDFMIKAESSSDLHKKSISDLRYYLQVYKKKMRSALISKNFEESNLSPQLSYNSHNALQAVGMKGGKLLHRHNFRKTKFTEVSEVGCIEPNNEFNTISHGAFKARNNKPNLMYNLNLFRKKYSKDGLSIKVSTHPIERLPNKIKPGRKIKPLRADHSRGCIGGATISSRIDC
jgi:hypothetical protein